MVNHLNWAENRAHFRQVRGRERQIPFKWLPVALLGAILLVMASCTLAHATITDQQGINACIGEAEGEPYLGKIAISATLLNRGHIKGVYGVNAPRVKRHLYSQATYEACSQAWKYAKSVHGEGDWNATGWGNANDIAIFKRQGWFKHCVITAHIGNHYFYREVR